MKSCESCKYSFCDYQTDAPECHQYGNMSEDEIEKYFMNGEDNCPFYEECYI